MVAPDLLDGLGGGQNPGQREKAGLQDRVGAPAHPAGLGHRGGVDRLTSAEQDVLYCVVTRLEIGKVKAIVRAHDASAFIVSHVLADVEGGVVKHTALP